MLRVSKDIQKIVSKALDSEGSEADKVARLIDDLSEQLPFLMELSDEDRAFLDALHAASALLMHRKNTLLMLVGGEFKDRLLSRGVTSEAQIRFLLKEARRHLGVDSE